MTAFLLILRRYLLAFGVGWIVLDLRYYTNFVLNKPDPSLDARDIAALAVGSAIITLIFIVLSVGLGLFFLIEPIRTWWLWISDRAVIPLVVGTGLLLYSGNLDLPIWIGLNLCMIFPIVNWPGKATTQ